MKRFHYYTQPNNNTATSRIGATVSFYNIAAVGHLSGNAMKFARQMHIDISLPKKKMLVILYSYKKRK